VPGVESLSQSISDHELESRMRENRLSGLGGGRRSNPFSIHIVPRKLPGQVFRLVHQVANQIARKADEVGRLAVDFAHNLFRERTITLVMQVCEVNEPMRRRAFAEPCPGSWTDHGFRG
jgi:hypothetical protein